MDALRSVLMIWGIAVHTSTLSISPALQQVARISGYVRMEGFMAISGLLAGLLLERYGHGPMIRRRLVSLGLPLLTTLILLNPVTNYLAYCFHNEPIAFSSYLAGQGDPRAEGPMYWHLHLWFLFSLLAYALLTPLLSRIVDWKLRTFGPLIQRVAIRERFLALALAIPASCLGTRLLFEFLIEPYLARDLVFVTRSTLYYLPFYALGLTLYRSAPLLEAFTRIHLRHLLIASLLVITVALHFRGMPKLTAETLKLLSEAYLSVVLAATLFSLARRFFAAERPWITYFADAAYSIYLLHFFAIYVVATALRPSLGDTGTLVVAVMLLAFVSTVAVHHFLIRRIPLLRLLFNGRPARRAHGGATAGAGAAESEPGPAPAGPALQISRP